MKLVCINNIHHEDRLSVGKVYDFIKMTHGDDSAYLITDDNGDSWALQAPPGNKFSGDRWVHLDEWREGKLNQIGI